MLVFDHTALSHSMEGSDAYRIRPNHQDKFKPAIVKEYIREIVREHLSDVEYEQDNAKEMSTILAKHIKDKVKTLGFDQYKFVVQVVIGKQQGQGVKISCKCLWDADTDSHAEDVFVNDSLFCSVAVFGIYYY